jgi:hypothetical protein
MPAQSADALLADYRRMMEDELFRSRREHELYQVLLDYPQLTERRRGGAGDSASALCESLGPRQSRKRHVGMTSPEEQAYCEWFASHLYHGAGEWLELGSFLGSLTIPSALGLDSNPRPSARFKKIRVFDLFLWDSVMSSSVQGTAFEGCCKEGDSFLDLYRKNIAAVAHRVEVTQTDLVNYRYTGEPIEYLMVDVMKYEALAANVLKQFFGRVLPGVGYVFHQDYLHFYEGWITLSMYRLREYFTPVCEVRDSAAVVFRCVRQAPESKLVFPLDSAAISRDWIEEAFDWSSSVVGEEHRHEVAATKVMMLVHSRRLEEAGRLYRESVKKYPGSYSFGWMTEYLKNDRNLEF